MTKKHVRELFSIIAQVLPFLMTTLLFIGFAYTYTHPYSYCHDDNVATLVRLSCNSLL